MARPSSQVAGTHTLAENRTNHRWVVMGLIFFVWAIACADRANFGIALPFLKKEYGISNTDAGLIVSLFSFAYGFVRSEEHTSELQSDVCSPDLAPRP